MTSPNGLPVVYVGRGSAWGNPYVIGRDGTAEQCVRKYAEFILPYTHRGPNSTMGHFMHSECMLIAMEIELRGKNLACWCPLGACCHADWLLKMANDPDTLRFEPANAIGNRQDSLPTGKQKPVTLQDEPENLTS